MNVDEKMWSRKLAPYCEADSLRASWELGITLVLFAGLWALALVAFNAVNFWASLPFSFFAGVLLVRVFIIQHDCGHYALFASRRVNDWIGRCLAVLTFTPYDDWRREHALHHASSGNLHRRGIGDIDTLTVQEYRARGRFGRLTYRAYRAPFTLFFLGAAYQFLLRHRWPTGDMKTAMPIISVACTNLGILAALGLMAWLVGWQALLAIQLPAVLTAASLGIWLFYVQHQFDETHWSEPPEWNREHAALHGSSFYDLPAPLMWLTGNIGIHHVHHMASRLPFHRLPQVLKDYPELREIGRITLMESIRCIPLALWCEERRELVSFRQAKALA